MPQSSAEGLTVDNFEDYQFDEDMDLTNVGMEDMIFESEFDLFDETQDNHYMRFEPFVPSDSPHCVDDDGNFRNELILELPYVISNPSEIDLEEDGFNLTFTGDRLSTTKLTERMNYDVKNIENNKVTLEIYSEDRIFDRDRFDGKYPGSDIDIIINYEDSKEDEDGNKRYDFDVTKRKDEVYLKRCGSDDADEDGEEDEEERIRR